MLPVFEKLGIRYPEARQGTFSITSYGMARCEPHRNLEWTLLQDAVACDGRSQQVS